MREKIARRILMHTTDARWTGVGLADAVLEALMEPTDRMISDGEAIMDMVVPEGVNSNDAKGRQEEFRAGFRAAIHAARNGQ